MENVNEKLARFQEICNTMSKNEKSNMKKELDKKAKKNIEYEVEIYKKKLNFKLEKEKVKIKKEYNCRLIDLEIQAKKLIIKEKERQKKELYDICKKRLEEYTDTYEYKESLNKIIDNTKKYLGEQESFTLYITKKDYELIEKTRFSEIEILEEKYIGGVMLKKDNIVIDNTFLTNLKETIYEE